MKLWEIPIISECNYNRWDLTQASETPIIPVMGESKVAKDLYYAWREDTCWGDSIPSGIEDKESGHKCHQDLPVKIWT